MNKQIEYHKEPTHPYASAPDAIHGIISGPTRLPIREPAIGRPEPAYTTTAKVHSLQIAKTVYERAMETLITVTQRELLSLSPEVWAHVADVTTKKCVSREQAAMVMIEEVPEEDDSHHPENRQNEEI